MNSELVIGWAHDGMTSSRIAAPLKNMMSISTRSLSISIRFQTGARPATISDRPTPPTISPASCTSAASRQARSNRTTRLVTPYITATTTAVSTIDASGRPSAMCTQGGTGLKYVCSSVPVWISVSRRQNIFCTSR